MHFTAIDYFLLFTYIALVIGIGLYVSRTKKGTKKDTTDYFLAGKALPWWAIGASLIAANISAEQFIGMSGSGYAIGLGIASYEFMSALTLVIVAVFFMPIFLQKKIYSMPQFLEQRYNRTLKIMMAVFWLFVFIFVNLSSILYLGALTIKNVLLSGETVMILGMEMDALLLGIILLGGFAAAYSVYGGLKAVALTDVIQVVFLIGGGLLTTYIALRTLGNGNFVSGFSTLTSQVPEKFDMILDRSHPEYKNLPGISVILGGMWVANLYYWGCNQYIIQRALAARSVGEAQKGLIFAGFLKLLLPLIVVIPGIVAFALNANLSKPDAAYPWLLNNFVPTGIKGIAFAALIAAVVSSLASLMNSIATIFTMDIYKGLLNRTASETKLVRIGRSVSGLALIIAIPVAMLLQNLDQAFQFIQEFTGFISPGALAIFLMGFFWKRATPTGAVLAAIGTFVFSLLFKVWMPGLPFMDRMGIVFLICMAIIYVTGILQHAKPDERAIVINRELFRTSTGFKVASAIIVVILVFIYALWW